MTTQSSETDRPSLSVASPVLLVIGCLMASPDAKTRIYWGDGKGGFLEQEIARGKAHHESRLGDLNGDGKIDILGKPYNYGSPGLHIWLQQ